MSKGMPTPLRGLEVYECGLSQRLVVELGSKAERRIDWPMMDRSVMVEKKPVAARRAGSVVGICQPLVIALAGMTALVLRAGVPTDVADMFSGEYMLSCTVSANDFPVIFSRARASRQNAALE